MTEVLVREHPFATVFADALRGVPCEVHGLDDDPTPLPVRHWSRQATGTDLRVLEHCVGATLDVGCGPGRMSAHLAAAGHCVLGIDTVPEAVEQARSRGVSALRRDIFESLPGEGRWETALLADGNLGIGGDPVRLLRRLHGLLGVGGRVVADLAPYGVGLRTVAVQLRTPFRHSVAFDWSVVGVEMIAALAQEARFAVHETHQVGGRWFAVLLKEG